jgi:hypothetical protein
MSQRYQGKQPLHRLQYDLKRKYDLSLEGYFALLEEQEGKCAICGNIFCDSNERRLCVDHNHETGKVRGLLCFNCNTGLGKFNDDLGLLKKTIVYLEGEI